MSQTERALNIRQVAEIVGLSRTTIYCMVAAGRFPRGRKVGEASVRWLQSEVSAWLSSRPVNDGIEAKAERAREAKSRC